MFSVLSLTCFSNEKAKTHFFVTKNSKQRDFVASIQKRIFATMRLKKGYSQTKNEIAFCNKMLETSDFLANTPKHALDKIKGQKHSLRRKTRKSLFSET